VVDAGQTLRVPVIGVGGVPTTGVVAAAVNVTVDQPAAPGFVTVFGCGSAPPLASNLNYATGQVVANVATAPVVDGAVCVYTWAPTHVIVDVSGYFTNVAASDVSRSTASPAAAPARSSMARMISTTSGWRWVSSSRRRTWARWNASTAIPTATYTASTASVVTWLNADSLGDSGITGERTSVERAD
jgi:hypothetical protein